MKISIKLDHQDLLHASKLACAAEEKFFGERGHYGTASGVGWNTFRRHFVGKLGEIAVHKLMIKTPYRTEPYFQMPLLDSHEDLRIYGAGWYMRVEVKTWSTDVWRDKGRCIRPEQRNSMFLHRDLIIWCRSEHPPIYKPDQIEHSATRIDLMGYSMIHDISNMVLRETGKGQFNYQLDEVQMRGMETLTQTFVSFAINSKI